MPLRYKILWKYKIHWYSVVSENFFISLKIILTADDSYYYCSDKYRKTYIFLKYILQHAGLARNVK